MSTHSPLSKSKIFHGLICHKRAYLDLHFPELSSPINSVLQARLDTGVDVGIKGRDLFPNGHLVDKNPSEKDEAILETEQVISKGINTIYEASFGNRDYFCRVDILHRNSAGEPWKIYEVKSGMNIKEEYIIDLSIQCWILQQCGINWSEAGIVYLNRKTTYPDLSNLFIKEERTDQVKRNLDKIAIEVNILKKIIGANDVPNISIGRYCYKPHKCRFKEHCWKQVPDPSVFSLPSPWKLFDKGKLDLQAVTNDDLSKSQKTPFNVIKTGKNYINIKSLKQATKDWKFPIYHLDFETISPAIPRFKNTNPYTQIPFQFSLHIQNNCNVSPSHYEYLHGDTTDPRRILADRIIQYIPNDDSIVMAYNSTFEKQVLKKLSSLFPELKDSLLSITNRLVDPLPIIRANIYHKDFNGSFSLKSIAPALLGQKWNYSKLEVTDGTMAGVIFDDMINPKTSETQAHKLRQDLLDYCSQDTLAMVELINWIYSQTKGT